MLTVCCRICLQQTHFKQVVSLFDTYKGFVIRDALLELFQIRILPTEMLSTICHACLVKVCTVREIREEFIAQESKYQLILCNSPKEKEDTEPTLNPPAEAEPSPTVESTTEEHNVGDGTESTEASEPCTIEQENLVIQIDDNDDGKLENEIEPSHDLDVQEKVLKHSALIHMHAELPCAGHSPEIFQITKCTQNEGESGEDIEISKLETHNEESLRDGHYRYDVEDAVESPAASNEIEGSDTNCMYICERCVLCFETDEAYESHTCAMDEGQSGRNSSCNPVSKYEADAFGNVSPTKQTYECYHCSDAFEEDVQLLKHCRAQHPTEFKTLPCTLCTAEYASHSALTDHIETQHPSGYRCKFCNKRVRNSFALKSHENVHTRQQTFSCTVCFRKFAQYTSLWRHMSIHNDIKAYECDICERRFRQKSVMLAHRRTHTGEKPYACEVCPKRFRDHSTLAKHRRVHAKGKK